MDSATQCTAPHRVSIRQKNVAKEVGDARACRTHFSAFAASLQVPAACRRNCSAVRRFTEFLH